MAEELSGHRLSIKPSGLGWGPTNGHLIIISRDWPDQLEDCLRVSALVYFKNFKIMTIGHSGGKPFQQCLKGEPLYFSNKKNARAAARVGHLWWERKEKSFHKWLSPLKESNPSNRSPEKFISGKIMSGWKS